MVNDLVAAAYPWAGQGQAPVLVCQTDLDKACGRRRRLMSALVTARFVAFGLAAFLWWANPGPVLRHPMDRVARMVNPHAGISDDLARPLAAALIAAVFYTVVVVIWKVARAYVMHLFFLKASRAPSVSQPVGGEQQANASTVPVAT